LADYRIPIERLDAIIARFPEKRVLVVGDVMLDRYVYGSVSRISPEAPVPVVRVDREESRLGGAANVAKNLASLGAQAFVCGIIGHDAEEEMLTAKLSAQEIDSRFLVTDNGRPTTRKVRIIAHQQQVVRVDYEDDSPVPEQLLGELVDRVREAIPQMDAVILSDYGKGVVTEDLIRAVVETSGAKQFVAVDPKVKHFSNYRGVSLVTPNLAEAGLAAGEKIVDEASLLRAGNRLLELLPGTSVLLTRGEHGMSLFQPGEPVIHIPTAARNVYDVTGAGDTVISTFALAVTAGASHLEAASLANHAAGEVIEEIGATAITVEGLVRSFAETGG